jgi:hypothetical protein
LRDAIVEIEQCHAGACSLAQSGSTDLHFAARIDTGLRRETVQSEKRGARKLYRTVSQRVAEG